VGGGKREGARGGFGWGDAGRRDRGESGTGKGTEGSRWGERQFRARGLEREVEGDEAGVLGE